MIVGISDKLLLPWLKDKEYMNCSDEGEAVGIAGGYFLATGKRATVFLSADGFCNALNPLTSWVIPENIEMNIVVSVGRQESQHKIMSDILGKIIGLLQYDPTRIYFQFVRREP